MDLYARDKYRHVKRKLIKTTDDLLDFMKDMDDNDKLITTYDNIHVKTKPGAADGIFVHIGRYSTEKQEFTDPFDFPDGFYTHTVYLPDREKGKPCLELVPAVFNYGKDQTLITQISLLRCFLEVLKKKFGSIPVISRDSNFELKGSVTNCTYLDIYEEIATGRKYMILDMPF